MCKWFLLLASVLLVTCEVHAQPTPTAGPSHYRFGDDPDGSLGWSRPDFDDRAWPVASPQGPPRAAFHSDGFVWVRTRVALPAGVSGPFAIEIFDPDSAADVQQLFVNGVEVGHLGRMPPRAAPVLMPRTSIFPLPADLALPGSKPVVVLREWFMPASRGVHPHAVGFVIDRAPVLQAYQRADRAERLIAQAPFFGVAALLEVLGLVVLWLARRTRQRDLTISGAWLIALPLYLVSQIVLFVVRPGVMPEVLWNVIFSLIDAAGMCINVEFVYLVLGVPSKSYRVLAHGLWIVFTVADIGLGLAFRPSPFLVPLPVVGHWALVLFNVIGLAALLWVLFIKRQNRWIAGVMCLIALAAFLNGAALFPVSLGTFPEKFFNCAFFLAGLTIAAMLLRKALAAWRGSNDLRVEFQSAREMQQRLVPQSLPPTPGFRIETAYFPAAEVGGDFYQVIPQRNGATLIVLGDVSGKGLKAAMTGTLVIGALRALAAEDLPPAALLSRLNRQMVEAKNGGFITCLCALLYPDGKLILASAGHLSPYLNGSEVSLENGLPLGLTCESDYVDLSIRVAPDARLTLLTDGVVEAMHPSGELFGFDRTAAASTQSAGEIARIARLFGQEDDITVLTLQCLAPPFLPA